MMLKRNIKIILVGLFSLLFLGLIYSLVGAKPEIISDDSLRVEEPVIPSLEARVERAMQVSGSESTPVSEAQFGDSFDKDLTSQSFTDSQEMTGSEELQSSRPAQEGVTQLSVDESSAQELSDLAVSAKEVVVDATVDKPKVLRADISSSVNPFETGAVVQSEESVAENETVEGKDGFLAFDRSSESEVANAAEPELSQGEVEQDVTLAPDASDFIDLNLNEVEPSIPNTVLHSGEQLIVDDINNGLSKLNADSSGEKDGASTDLTSVEEVVSDIDAPVAQVFPFEASGFVMPKVDPELMQGDSEISKQYRETMNKIISINAKLRDADTENAELQVQFEMAVDQNRQLAQIIRDIDTQIKALTITN